MACKDRNEDREAIEPEAGELTTRGGLAVRYRIRVASGEEAKLLRRRQAEAIRALLRWLVEEKKR